MSVLRFRRGTVVSTHDAFAVKDAPTLLEIHGTAASLFGRDVLGNRAFGSVVLRMGGVEEQVDVGPAHDLCVDATSAFATSIARVGSPRCRGADGLQAVAAGEAIAAAARTGTETVVENPWPYKGHNE
jgi:1,5-anhydro-D-fructose reductase (1,5-anhydro-D-mannitol-forming)